VFRIGALSTASTAAVSAVLIPVKVVTGGAVGAWLYPFLSHRRLAGRYVSRVPIPPKYASRPPEEDAGAAAPTETGTADPPGTATSTAGRPASGRGRSRAGRRRR